MVPPQIVAPPLTNNDIIKAYRKGKSAADSLVNRSSDNHIPFRTVESNIDNIIDEYKKLNKSISKKNEKEAMSNFVYKQCFPSAKETERRKREQSLH